MSINRQLLRQKIEENGGIRKFAKATGLSHQALYNAIGEKTPNYYTICQISKGLGLTDDQILEIWFVRKGVAG